MEDIKSCTISGGVYISKDEVVAGSEMLQWSERDALRAYI